MSPSSRRLSIAGILFRKFFLPVSLACYGAGPEDAQRRTCPLLPLDWPGGPPTCLVQRLDWALIHAELKSRWAQNKALGQVRLSSFIPQGSLPCPAEGPRSSTEWGCMGSEGTWGLQTRGLERWLVLLQGRESWEACPRGGRSGEQRC